MYSNPIGINLMVGEILPIREKQSVREHFKGIHFESGYIFSMINAEEWCQGEIRQMLQPAGQQ